MASEPGGGGRLSLRVGCRFEYRFTGPTPAVIQVEPHPRAGVEMLSARWEMPSGADPALEVDHYGNRVRRAVLPAGDVAFVYDATLSMPNLFDIFPSGAGVAPVESLPARLLHYLLPSRLCPSDVLMRDAWDLFGDTPPDERRVQAINDWVHGNIAFQYGASDPRTTAADVFAGRRGVCRDFAHLAVSMCRAVNVPARYAFGYIPDIAVPLDPAPMDFCAWTEVYLGGRWWTYDPRNNRPRVGRVLIARGRDALDVAMMTTWGGNDLRGLTVWADEVAA